MISPKYHNHLTGDLDFSIGFHQSPAIISTAVEATLLAWVYQRKGREDTQTGITVITLSLTWYRMDTTAPQISEPTINCSPNMAKI